MTALLLESKIERAPQRLVGILGFLAIGCAIVVSGCASRVERNSSDPQAMSQDMFVSTFEDIDAVYINEPDIGSLALDSLAQLHNLDRAVEIKRSGDKIDLIVNKQVVRSYSVEEDLSPEEWGILTSEALADAQAESPIVRATAQEDLFEGMLAPAVHKLDNFSRYSSAEVAKENRATRDGFGGIGVRISVEDDVVRVVSVMHYTPAERMGVQRDDIIVAIDNVPTKGMSQQEVVNRLRGPVDSKVAVQIQRAGRTGELTIVLARAHVVPETVNYRREGNVAYFRIYSFNSETTDSLRRAVRNAEQEIGEKLRGIVIDLRDNPGGLLNQSVAMSNLFLSEGRIVSTHGRHPDSHQFFEASGGDIAHGKPIIVLIDGNSASAAEIVAAALQDNGRAVVVGSNSYGKGTVQTVLPLPNEGEITLTWARFHAPSGYTLHGLGVLPTICTSGRSDAKSLIADLNAGLLPQIPIGKRNSVSPEDTIGLSNLRKLCPAQTTEGPLDLEIALRLLDRPELFAHALVLAEPPQLGSNNTPSQPEAALVQ